MFSETYLIRSLHISGLNQKLDHWKWFTYDWTPLLQSTNYTATLVNECSGSCYFIAGQCHHKSNSNIAAERSFIYYSVTPHYHKLWLINNIISFRIPPQFRSVQFSFDFKPIHQPWMADISNSFSSSMTLPLFTSMFQSPYLWLNILIEYNHE